MAYPVRTWSDHRAKRPAVCVAILRESDRLFRTEVERDQVGDEALGGVFRSLLERARRKHLQLGPSSLVAECIDDDPIKLRIAGKNRCAGLARRTGGARGIWVVGIQGTSNDRDAALEDGPRSLRGNPARVHRCRCQRGVESYEAAGLVKNDRLKQRLAQGGRVGFSKP